MSLHAKTSFRVSLNALMHFFCYTGWVYKIGKIEVAFPNSMNKVPLNGKIGIPSAHAWTGGGGCSL